MASLYKVVVGLKLTKDLPELWVSFLQKLVLHSAGLKDFASVGLDLEKHDVFNLGWFGDSDDPRDAIARKFTDCETHWELNLWGCGKHDQSEEIKDFITPLIAWLYLSESRTVITSYTFDEWMFGALNMVVKKPIDDTLKGSGWFCWDGENHSLSNIYTTDISFSDLADQLTK